MSENNERLRALLRQGDPAGDAPGRPGLTREEAGRMRRAILTAAPETRRRPLWLPVAAAAAVAVLTLAIALGLWRARTELPVHETPEHAAVVPAPAAPVPAPTPSSVSAAPEALPAATPSARPRSHRTRRAAPAPVRLASLPAPPSPAEENEEPGRQIQFSTPGGTRVIWVLSHETVVE